MGWPVHRHTRRGQEVNEHDWSDWPNWSVSFNAASDRGKGIPVSAAPKTQPDNQSFAETALRLGGKSDEEVRRTGAMDKADEQVEKLFAERLRTTGSPVHRAVWGGKVPVAL